MGDHRQVYSSTDEQLKDKIITGPSWSKFAGQRCVLGIDEAGRGPVLGPMVYGLGVSVVEKEKVLKEMKVDDSKALTEQKRDELFDTFNTDDSVMSWFTYRVCMISPVTITTSMLGRVKTSLNELSFNAAFDHIQAAIDLGVSIEHVYVDTVGKPEVYQAKMNQRFPGIDITVSKKADALFPIVGAASVCAKVVRDVAVKTWQFPEPGACVPDAGVGSGYPGDPTTIKFLDKNVDTIFGFPSLVRGSWGTAKDLLEKRGPLVEWQDEVDEARAKKGAKSRSMNEFFASDDGPRLVPRHMYFSDRNVKNCVDF